MFSLNFRSVGSHLLFHFFSTYFKEDHNQPIFGTAFCHHLKPGEPIIFASAGSNRVTVYECQKNGGIKLLQCYSDPDTDEVFYVSSYNHLATSLMHQDNEMLISNSFFRHAAFHTIQTQHNQYLQLVDFMESFE